GGDLVGKLPKALLLGGYFVASLGARADEASPQEFPLFDQTLASHAQLRMVARKATQALADAPESPETLSALLLAKRWDNAAGVLHAIVAQHPGDLPRALDAVSEGWSAAPDSRRFGEALAVELPEARNRLGERPREAAAHATWRIALLELRVPGAVPRNAEKVLDPFFAEYRGTDEAAILEAGRIEWRTDPTPKFRALDRLVATHPGTVVAAQA